MKRIKEDVKGARNAPNYFWGARKGECIPAKKENALDTVDKMGSEQPIENINDLIVQNPGMSAPTFLNLLKSRGFKITKEAMVSEPALDRAGVKKLPNKESAKTFLNLKFLEASSGRQGNEKYQSVFRVVLIQEGLGNTADGFYYTKEALKSGVPVFEGKKMYADHPSKMDDAMRPERSVRDIAGHYENVAYLEAEDGTARLEADVVVLSDPSSDWVRARFVQAIEYAKKYPDKDFIGLSINASGDAEPMDAADFLKSGNVVPSAIPKLEKAILEGLTEVKVTNIIDSAVSVDLVTEAGARGKVLELLEAEEMSKQKKLTEAEEKKKEEAAPVDKKDEAPAADAEKKPDDAGHDDEAKDKALIMDQMKKHGLIKDGEQEDGEMMQAAKHYHQAYKAAGHKPEDAAERAVEAMKCAHSAQEAMKKEAEAKEAKEAESKKEADKDDDKENKESEVLRLKGENAKLLERINNFEVIQYLETKLKESKLPMSVTKKFKESAKLVKSKKEADEKFELFMEGYRATGAGGEAISDLGEFVLATEKETMRESGEISDLSDCVEE